MGDLNSYAKEDPIDAIKAGADDAAGTGDDYTNLIAQFQGEYAYSYIFDGQAGYLDHALASASLAAAGHGADGLAHQRRRAGRARLRHQSFKPPAQDALYEPNATGRRTTTRGGGARPWSTTRPSGRHRPVSANVWCR